MRITRSYGWILFFSLGATLFSQSARPLLPSRTVTGVLRPGVTHVYSVAPQLTMVEITASGASVLVDYGGPRGERRRVEADGDPTPIYLAAAGLLKLRLAEDGPSATVSLIAKPAPLREDLLETQTLTAQALKLAPKAASERYLEAARKWELAGDIRNAAAALAAAAEIQSHQGGREAAAAHHERAAEICASAKLQACQARSLLAAGTAYDVLGKPTESRDRLARSLTLYESLSDLRGQARVRKQIGEMEDTVGNKDEALRQYEQSLQLFRKAADGKGEGQVLSDIGVTYYSIGHPERALTYYRRANPLLRSARDRQNVAVNYLNIGVAHEEMGELDQALINHKKALPVFKAIHDDQNRAYCLHGIGATYRKLGNDALAERYIARSLQLFRKAADMRGETTALNNLGRIYMTSGRPLEALRTFEQALEKFEKAEIATGKAYALSNIGDAYVTLQQQDKARLHLNRAIATFQSIQDRSGESFALHRRARSFREQGDFESAQRDITAAMALVESFRTELENENNRASYFAGVRDLHEFQVDLLALRDKAEPARGYAEKAFESCEKFRARSLLEALPGSSSRGKETALLQPEAVSLGELQNELLDPDVALIQYILGDERSYGWVVTKQRFRMVVLPKRSVIEREVRQLTRALPSPAPGPSSAALVGQILLQPFRDDIAGKKLVISADGILQLVPFGVLPVSARRLINRHEVVMIPSASVLKAIRRQSSRRQPPPKYVAVFADAVYEAEDSRLKRKPTPADQIDDLRRSTLQVRGRNRAGFTRLQNTAAEGKTIFDLAPRGSATLLTDFEVSRANVLRADLGQYRVIHFAVHGLMNSDQPELSGLALSQFDADGQRIDSFLRVADVYNLRAPVELVVLSACETAAGRDVKGEGVVSLTRAFLYAGAARVVASLWEVPDASTRELMALFYQAMIQNRLSPAAALRRAQLAMARNPQYRDPYYWAGFTLHGEWR